MIVQGYNWVESDKMIFMGFSSFSSPLGQIALSFDHSLHRVDFVDGATNPSQSGLLGQQIEQQLNEYFTGIRQVFELPLQAKGTEFQLAVWQVLQQIPYGQTWSYLQVANKLGKPKAVRAVGQAIGANPLPIIVPCHRVIASNGMLGGFSSGLWRKEWLLALEKSHCGSSRN